MTIDLTLRLGEIGAVLAEKMPGVLDAIPGHGAAAHGRHDHMGLR